MNPLEVKDPWPTEFAVALDDLRREDEPRVGRLAVEAVVPGLVDGGSSGHRGSPFVLDRRSKRGIRSFFLSGARGRLVGRLAQRESTCLTSRGSLVRIQYRPPSERG